MKNMLLAKKGEDLACNYLKKLGQEIISRNFRIRGGEIDIIARDRNTLVFVEVKTRMNNKFGYPQESVTPKKIKFIEKAAKFFRLSSKLKLPELERIDVVTVSYSSGKPKIELIKNAGFI